MHHMKMKRAALLPVAAGLALTAAMAPAQWKPKDTEWPTYNADTMGSRYRAARSDQRIQFQTSSKSPGASRPTASATAPSSSSKARR